MPIFEYACRACGREFEQLVRTGDVPACPSCASHALEKQPSLAAISSPDSRAANVKKARRAGRLVNQEKEMAHQDEVREHYGAHGLATAKPKPMRKKGSTSG
jgi:putative FmdB family regulatory protein